MFLAKQIAVASRLPVAQAGLLDENLFNDAHKYIIEQNMPPSANILSSNNYLSYQCSIFAPFSLIHKDEQYGCKTAQLAYIDRSGRNDSLTDFAMNQKSLGIFSDAITEITNYSVTVFYIMMTCLGIAYRNNEFRNVRELTSKINHIKGIIVDEAEKYGTDIAKKDLIISWTTTIGNNSETLLPVIVLHNKEVHDKMNYLKLVSDKFIINTYGKDK